MSGKRAKPKGARAVAAAPTRGRRAARPTDSPPSASTPAADAEPLVTASPRTATDLLERPVFGDAVLPAGQRAGARNAARADRRRRERQRRLVAAAVAAVVLVALVGWFATHRGGTPPAASPVAAARSQQTVLLVVKDTSVTGLALLAADPATGEGSLILLPPRLNVDVAGYGPMTLGAAAVLPKGDAAADALADTLGITVDGTWTLDTASLAALVDAAGGVTVDVDVDVTAPGPTKGSEVIVIPAGTQSLDGASAAVYASFLGAGEPEQSRLARLDAVLSAALSGLPTDPDQLTLALGTLGAGSNSTLPEKLPGFLAALRTADAATAVLHRTLPVTALDAGAALPTVGVDAKAAAALVDDLLGSSKAAQRPGGAVRVLVQNGVGTPGLGSSARDQLVKDGFTYVAGGNAAKFGTARSLVLISENTAEQRATGAAVVAALGLPESALRVTTQGQSIADVVVVLGKDYKS